MFLMTLTANVFASNPSVKGKEVTYKGQTFIINAYNEEEAINEIANAKKVYAFVVSEVDMSTGNSFDFPDTYINSSGKFAVECYVSDKNYQQKCFIIFDHKGAKVKKTLPKGFEFNISEIDHAGNSGKAGYCHAINNGMYNSFIVYVK